jgi:hypothetical protein
MNGAAEVASIPSILVSRNIGFNRCIDSGYGSYIGFVVLGTLRVGIVSTCPVFVGQLEADGMDGVIRLETINCWSSFRLRLSEFPPVTGADSYNVLCFQFLVLVAGSVSNKVLRWSA